MFSLSPNNELFIVYNLEIYNFKYGFFSFSGSVVLLFHFLCFTLIKKDLVKGL